MTRHRQLQWIVAVASILAAAIAAFAQTAARLPADLDPDSRARLPYLQRKNLDEASQKIFDVLPGRSPEGVLSGPLAFAAYNPAVANALFDLHNAAVRVHLTRTCASWRSWWPAAKPITAWNGTLTSRAA